MVATIGILPNEILSSILSLFSTTALLPLTLTSHCFYNIIVQILQTRLFNASTLSGHKLILECFHPSAKVFTPYLFVDNLGTGSCDRTESESRMLSKIGGTNRLGKLKTFYSHFRPLLPDEIHMSRRRRASSWGFDQSNSLTEIQSEYVCQNIHLESHELFSQLCTLTNMVKEGQKPGIILSCITISGGVIRVWRDWLAERYASSGKFSTLYSRHNTMDEEEESRKCLLWADPRENVGIRIRVLKREDVESPILAGPDDEASVSYTLQYEELVIRTTQLLLMLERSNDQVGSTARGVIIGPFS